MRAIGLVSLGLMMVTLPVTDAAAASNAWCAVYNRQGGTSENCGYATLNQCRAQVLGLGLERFQLSGIDLELDDKNELSRYRIRGCTLAGQR